LTTNVHHRCVARSRNMGTSAFRPSPGDQNQGDPSDPARFEAMRPKAHIMPGMPIPDLLSHSPVVRLDAAALKQTLTFGFASGVPGTALAQHLESALPTSSWEPGSFAKELFLSELIAGCCKVMIETRTDAIYRATLARILARPPREQEDFEMRRGVLRDLASSETRR